MRTGYDGSWVLVNAPVKYKANRPHPLLTWLHSLSDSERWAYGLGATALAVIAAQVIGQWVNHFLSARRAARSDVLGAADRLRDAFRAARARLDAARRHGSNHARPDASALLKDAFEVHKGAVSNFRPFVHSENRRLQYDQAWEDYCKLANPGVGGAEFVTEFLYETDDPWSILEKKIHAILQFTET